MDYDEFDYRSGALDELSVSVCKTCRSLVYNDDQTEHTAWHRRLDDFQRDIYGDIYRGSGE